MSKEIYISSTPHETRLAIVEKDELTEIYYERENEYTLAGSIYNGRVTRVLPGMQSSFVDIGLERDAFLYITDFLEEANDSADFESASGDLRPESRTEPRPPSRERTGERREGQDRGERRDRGGRGRRDRSRTDDRPRADTPVPEPVTVIPVEEEPFLAVSPVLETEEIGEGAPGADGSRRWRGRRGRRRGRSLAGESPAETASFAEPVESSSADALPTAPYVEPLADPYSGDASSDAPTPAPVSATPETGPRADRSRDRGGRRRNPDRNPDRPAPRSNRQDSDRDRFAPRGDRSDRSDRNGVDAATVDVSAAAEPFILPGESLSKYRRGDSASESPARSAQSAPANLVTARPSTEIAPLVGWDGGAILPGETLSRHRDRAPQSASQPAPQARTEGRSESSRDGRNESFDRGADRRRERDGRRGRAPRPQSEQPESDRQQFRPSAGEISPAEAVQPAITSQHGIEPYESETDALPVEIHATQAEVTEALEEFHETVAEYEPGHHASASYRVDPAGPSEFRQGSPLAELALEETISEHRFTAVQPSGEMISEIPEAASHPEAGTHPDAPIEHEQAIQSVHLDQAGRSAVPFDTAQGFAFGDGQLEEELLDDEDGTPSELHTASIAAPVSEDSEEETLEHAADLGSMIRDMSIDQITRPGAAEQDEEEEVDFDDDADFEEDELESTGREAADDEEFSGSDVSEAEEEDFAEAADTDESASAPRVIAGGDGQVREGGRRGRRDGRRGGRDRNPGRGSERSPDRSPDRSPERTSDRSPDRSASNGHRDRRGMANSRPGGDRRSGRHSVQASDLPAISDLLKPGQEVLVQIAKEPIAKKGARITSHIALPGRFLVFMPTVSHVGVSRKIESDAERRRLKEILLSERGEATGGFIVRTAAAGASEEDLRSDLRFLLNLWVDIKARSESSKSPALIYHDLNLIERILRDQVTDNFSAIWVDTEAEYERVLRFLQRFQPALVRRVKLYGKDTPLFEQFGINAEIDKALRSKVWLKSGGSIVINQTEALVAIDINTGKYVGKTTKLEDTIVKTNLDAIPEIVRQIRLRDLGGIIIIDFIDMDERKNRNRVMAALEEELKKDRAPSKVLQFNDFGLVAITRKRVKQSLERTLSTTCGVCQGTGMTKSAVTVCNDLYIEMRKMHRTIEKGDIMLRVHPEVVKQLKSGGGKWLQEMEEMSGKTILVKSDPTLHPEQFDIH